MAFCRITLKSCKFWIIKPIDERKYTRHAWKKVTSEFNLAYFIKGIEWRVEVAQCYMWNFKVDIWINAKYLCYLKVPVRGYFLGVLTHKTAWDQLWVGNETLKSGFKIEYRYIVWLCLAQQRSITLNIFFVTLEVYLTLCLTKFSVSVTFLGGRDRQTCGQTDFSQKILF